MEYQFKAQERMNSLPIDARMVPILLNCWSILGLHAYVSALD